MRKIFKNPNVFKIKNTLQIQNTFKNPAKSSIFKLCKFFAGSLYAAVCMGCFLTFTSSIFLNASAQAANTNYYAKIQNTGIYFFSSPDEATALFEIPYSYFVRVDGKTDAFFEVTYRDLKGYVKKSDVSLMRGNPITPYPNATFTLFVPYNLFSTASTTTSLVYMNENSTLSYYGTMPGQQITSNNNVWFYSSVISEGTTLHGYVFSGVTDLLSNITINNESFEIVDEKVLDNIAATSKFTGLSSGTQIVLIVAIAVPSLMILYFLIKPTKIMQITKSHRKKKESNKIHHGDYFEFDETQL